MQESVNSPASSSVIDEETNLITSGKINNASTL